MHVHFLFEHLHFYELQIYDSANALGHAGLWLCGDGNHGGLSRQRHCLWRAYCAAVHDRCLWRAGDGLLAELFRLPLIHSTDPHADSSRLFGNPTPTVIPYKSYC